MNWQEALAFASRPNGISAIVGFLSAWLAEYWPWFDRLTPKRKRVYYGLFCIAVPSIAATLLWLSGYATLDWETLYWPAILSGTTTYLAGQGTHTAMYLGKNP